VTTAERGAVVKGPDLFADYDHRPYVRLSDDTHPFCDEEGLYAAVTTTRRAAAISLSEDDFASGGLPRDSYVNPWTVVSIRHADLAGTEGRLVEEKTENIARATARYLGVVAPDQ
jgi:mRNA-degrading endonuclease toxin of MazEF toxin-antitoxin module